MVLAIVLIAQLPGVSSAPVSMLPDPPRIEHWLLESPWAPALFLIVAGVAVFHLANRAGKAREGITIGGLLALAGVAVIVLATLVTTTRESLIARTEQLIGLVARADTGRIAPLLAPDVRVTILGARQDWDRDAILRRIESQLGPGGRFAIKESAMISGAASVDGANVARTQARVRVTVESLGVPSFSWWRLHWRGESDGHWRLTGIEIMEIDGITTPVSGGFD